MIERTPDMFCLLCNVNKANASGSHFVSDCILKRTIGDRDNFVAYSIDTTHTKTEVSYGRASNPSTEPTVNPHARNYIFCQTCEDFFGALENIVCPILSEKLYHQNFASHFKNTRLTSDVTHVELLKLGPNVFKAFFYSQVWRLCLQQRLDTGASPINPKFERTLANALNSYSLLELKEYKNVDIEIPYPITVITSESKETKGAEFINTSFEKSNPELFYIGRFFVLVHHNLSDLSIPETTLPPEAFDLEYSNKTVAEHPQILLLSDDVFDSENENFAYKTQEKYIESLLPEYSAKVQLGPVEAKKKLIEEADKLSKAKDILLMHAIEEVYNNEMSNK